MKKTLTLLLTAVGLLLGMSSVASAQTAQPSTVVATCGTLSLSPGARAGQYVDTTGKLCAGVTVSANVATGGLAVSSTFNATFPVVGTAVGVKGTSGAMVPFLADSNGYLNITCAVGCAGGTSDTDDGTVAGAQDTGIQIALGYMWDGSNWKRALGDATNGLKVNGSGVIQPVSYATTGSGTATGAVRVELPTNGTGVIATVGAVTSITNPLPAGTNALGHVIADVGSTTAVTQATGTNLHAVIDSGTVTANAGIDLNTSNLALEGGGNLATSTGYLATLASTVSAAAVNVNISASSVNATEITADFDTGGGTQTLSMIGLALPASGGAVAGGTATNPIVMTGAGTAGTPAAGVTSVQGVTSGAPVSIIVCPDKTQQAWGTTNVTGTTTSNIIWYLNNGTTATRTAAGSGLKFWIYSAQLVNSGSTNVTVAVTQDGAAGVAPITMATWVAPTAAAAPMGGSNMTFPSPIFTPTANRAVSIGASGSTTTMYANFQGCVAP